ncbi:MAG: NAD(+) diphosphatase [Rhodospirillaceae bacterium]|nr:NAD(+) diphosphatase [Rhodospirillaceae bacterium]
MSADRTAPRFHLARSETNFYADSGLDRVSERRKDESWVAARFADPASRFVPLWRSRNYVDVEKAAALFLSGEECLRYETRVEETVFLGLAGEVAYFAADFSHIEAAETGPELLPPGRGSAGFLDLRQIGPRLGRQEGAILAYARGMETWHRRHRFCGQCGAPTRAIEGGHVRVCMNDACALQQFPRTDPAVIMLVTRGDSCLLGSNPRFPPGLYSTLAGFVEPGETLEAAVAREVMEEAGARVRNVRYHSSQPWPFPTSLMLGFYAEAEDEALTVNTEELRDARWFARDWLRAHAAEFNDTAAPFRLPRADSIARRLIEDWLAGEA